MGTSVNQSSPRTLNWSAAHAGYRNASIPAARVAAEVWRAALNQERGNIAQLLAQPVVARLGALAFKAESAIDLSRKTAFELAQSKQSSLGTELSRRAAIQCLHARDRVGGFAAGVFAEATAYLVSRDLPGFVGSGRARTVADSLEFKAALINHVAGVARSVEAPRSLDDPSGWKRHVEVIIDRLRRLPR
jgi:hypothetical protein